MVVSLFDMELSEAKAAPAANVIKTAIASVFIVRSPEVFVPWTAFGVVSPKADSTLPNAEREERFCKLPLCGKILR